MAIDLESEEIVTLSDFICSRPGVIVWDWGVHGGGQSYAVEDGQAFLYYDGDDESFDPKGYVEEGVWWWDGDGPIDYQGIKAWSDPVEHRELLFDQWIESSVPDLDTWDQFVETFGIEFMESKYGSKEEYFEEDEDDEDED